MYYVIKSVRIIEEERVSCAITKYDDIDEAKKKYYQDLAQDVGSSQYDYTLEEIINEDGTVLMKDVWRAPTE